MAIIKSGASSSLLTIDGTSLAARTSLYRPDGSTILATPVGEYFCVIPNLVQGTAIASGSCIWAMRNGSSKVIRVKFMGLNAGFSGIAAASTSNYQLCRFTSATPTGGTALTALKKRTPYGPSTVADIRYNLSAALTVTGVVFEAAWAEFGVQRQVTANRIFHYASSIDRMESCFELALNEGIGIRLGIVGVIGDCVSGMIAWEEI